ncbi:AraC family transcriptional regulator [uncultured Modestobacter sp.]|uniref:helix-turn-helix transcriptional regulator n=1 Tax=uncultured Modestobacter sp. TaxID=380048 RepID=UPI0026398030|nr:AraC family transcriptional regulator [uncultured Modestobacter sp.]
MLAPHLAGRPATSVPPPLHRFALCRSSDVAEFTTRLNDVYYPAEVAPRVGRVFGGPSVLRAVHTEDFTLGYIHPGGDVRVVPDRESTGYHVNLALSGSVVAVAGNTEVHVGPDTAAVHTAGQRHELRARADSGLIGLKLSTGLVERELSALLGRPVTGPVRFAPVLDLHSEAGRSWLAMVHFLLAELDRPGLFDSPAVRHSHVRSLVAGLLTGHQHSWTEALSARGAPLRPRTVRRAQEFVHEHFAEPLTVTDIARATGSSVRRLQEAFSAHLDVSPMGYLRDVRLDAARARLTEDGLSVTEAAQACGLTHLGRFSAAYRARFGELPSATAAESPTRG